MLQASAVKDIITAEKLAEINSFSRNKNSSRRVGDRSNPSPFHSVERYSEKQIPYIYIYIFIDFFLHLYFHIIVF